VLFLPSLLKSTDRYKSIGRKPIKETLPNPNVSTPRRCDGTSEIVYALDMKLIPTRSVRSVWVIGRPFMCVGMSRQETFQRILLLLINTDLPTLNLFLALEFAHHAIQVHPRQRCFRVRPIGRRGINTSRHRAPVFHILRRDFQVQQHQRRRSIVRTVGIVFSKSKMSLADTSDVRKGLSREGGVDVGIKNGCQRHDTLAVEELARMNHRILERFTGAECAASCEQESEQVFHGAVGVGVVQEVKRGLRS
jgi:hypothetical protein